MNRVLIWGGGGHGKVVADVARALGMEIAGFVDADPAKLGSTVEPGGAAVVLSEQALMRHFPSDSPPAGADRVVLAVGDNASRSRCRKSIPEKFLTVLVHPSAIVSPSARLDAGVVVMPGAIVNASAVVGPGAIINTGAVVEHDCVVAEDAHVAPAAVLSGGVRVGARTLVGAGSVTLPQIVIGSDATIGAGAVVVSAVADNATVAGNPARIVNS